MWSSVQSEAVRKSTKESTDSQGPTTAQPPDADSVQALPQPSRAALTQLLLLLWPLWEGRRPAGHLATSEQGGCPTRLPTSRQPAAPAPSSSISIGPSGLG